MNHPSGMRAFTVVWLGQLVSLVGSGMTRFALTFWAYQTTEKATTLALVGFFGTVPMLLLSPLAGALVDRGNRKLMMMLSDIAGGLTSLGIFALYASGHMQIWHLFVASAFKGTFEAFQWPAYSAAISTMIPKKQYARASGMMSLADSAAGIGAPFLAGLLLYIIRLNGILLIDIATFIVAIGTLLWVSVPQPKISEEGREARGSLLQESLFGFRYILARPSLLGLQTVFLFINLFATFSGSVFPAMILARTGNSALQLGSVESAFGIGGVVGGLLLAAWGGPKRKVFGVLGGMALAALLSGIPMGMGRTLPVWMTAAFWGSLMIPILNGSNQAIWQAKVPPDIQGKVFTARRLIAWVANPLSMLLAGPLADKFFTPALLPEGALAGTFGWLVGTGPGAGIGLMFVMTGVLELVVALGALAIPAIRYAEELVPDHDQAGRGPGTEGSAN